MRNWLKAVCLALCVTLTPLCGSAEGAAATPAASPAATSGQSAPTVRVLLKRLALTDRADLTLDGVYTAGDGETVSMAFPKGSQVTAQVREGEIYLFYAGLSLRAGATVVFNRHASADQQSEGIRFAAGGTFYPGDLTLTVDGGVLTPIVALSVEDYLLGVVPYEMSNDFPLEALKAQAVCARTYALAHVDKTRAWDVVDTTNDQVFKGVDLTRENAVRAVRETAGVVGTWQDALATCYYSASNGGQTELVGNVWSGRGDWGYYRMVDDPYDLENPESVVKRAQLNRDGSDVSDALRDIIANYLEKQMTEAGFGRGGEALRIDGITAASLGGNRLPAPSRLVTELTLTFTWSGRTVTYPAAETAAPSAAGASAAQDADILLFATPSPTPVPTATPAADKPLAVATATPTPVPSPTPVYGEFTPAAQSATLTLPLFPEVIRALKLSISGADNELVTLRETEDAFVLESRRYGHGVGMSQRGAQWMASQYGKTFTDILAFYYPGMVLKRVASGDPVLTTVAPALAESPAPPATPTPRPTLMPVTGTLPAGAYLASVEGIADDSSLNLRAEPNTAGEIIMRLYEHQQLVVLGAAAEDGWVKVRTDVVEGYVMVSFLQKLQ